MTLPSPATAKEGRKRPSPPTDGRSRWSPFAPLLRRGRRGLPPRARSVLFMALSIATHFAGYEFARNAALALFTSEKTGFGGGAASDKGGGDEEGGGGGGTAWALPLAVGCVGPFSVALLWLYTQILDRSGPRCAVRDTTALFAAVLFLSGATLTRMAERWDADVDSDFLAGDDNRGYSKYLIFALFVYQNSSVQLLCTQHWGFVTSVLTSEEGSVWFAPVAGLGSVSSTLAAGGVSDLVGRVGLVGLLHLAGWTVLISAYFADGAYAIAEEHGFAPTKEHSKNKKKNGGDGDGDGSGGGSGGGKSAVTATTTTDDDRDAAATHAGGGGGVTGLARRASSLFRRVPVLGALFVEVLLSQCLSSVLNYLFLTGVRDAIPDDDERAGWTGTCYAYINGISGIVQFGALPMIMKMMGGAKEDSSGWIWAAAPMSMAGLTAFAAVRTGHGRQSLFWIGAPFLTMKTIEYSLRSFAVEMLYVSLDYESRFVGKEVIGLFANRIGKSGMAVSLALAAATWGESAEMQRRLRSLSFVVSCCWLVCSLRLRSLLLEKKKNGKKGEDDDGGGRGGKTHPS